MTSPDFLPSLAAGAHDADAGEACIMEYVSLLAGEEWSDRPECTHPLLAHEARMLNDDLADRDRHLLVPLIGRLFGTTEDSASIRARLRLRQVAGVLRLLDPSARARVAAVIEQAELAEQEAGSSDDEAAVEQAREVARAFPSPEGISDDPAHEAHHLQLARMAFVGLVGDVGAAEAWAFAAQVVAHRVAASGECRADCGDSMSHARMRVRELADLLDEYDAVTGRVPRRLTTDEVRELSVLVG